MNCEIIDIERVPFMWEEFKRHVQHVQPFLLSNQAVQINHRHLLRIQPCQTLLSNALPKKVTTTIDVVNSNPFSYRLWRRRLYSRFRLNLLWCTTSLRWQMFSNVLKETILLNGSQTYQYMKRVLSTFLLSVQNPCIVVVFGVVDTNGCKSYLMLILVHGVNVGFSPCIIWGTRTWYKVWMLLPLYRSNSKYLQCRHMFFLSAGGA